MAKGVEVQLYNADGTSCNSLTDVQIVWFDTPEPGDFTQVKAKSKTVTTDSSGWLKLNLENVSGLDTGQDGFLVVYKKDATDHKDSLLFASKMTLSSVTGGTDPGPVSTWVRPASWLTLPDVTGLQKFAGLFAVYPESNHVALSAEGDYTLNWGDGSGNQNISSGVQAEKNIAWADAAASSDVGIAYAVAVTFTDSGDTVKDRKSVV